MIYATKTTKNSHYEVLRNKNNTTKIIRTGLNELTWDSELTPEEWVSRNNLRKQKYPWLDVSGNVIPTDGKAGFPIENSEEIK